MSITMLCKHYCAHVTLMGLIGGDIHVHVSIEHKMSNLRDQEINQKNIR